MIVYPIWKSSRALCLIGALIIGIQTAGCALSYIQGPDYQRLDLEVMRPINVNHEPEPVR